MAIVWGMAKLTAVYGPMFAGKTTWILKRVADLEQAGQKCLVFKPRLDNRYGGEAKIHAHSGISGEAVLVDEQDPGAMLRLWASQNEQHTAVVIDEVMFFDKMVVEVVKEMLARDLNVIVAGLDTDFRREPFGVMPHLIKLADEQAKLSAVCYKCGQAAEYTTRLVESSDQLVVGASESYQPACDECHTIPFDTPQVNYPYIRRRMSTGNGPLRIEVMADSMRVGKTTAVQVIAEGLRARGKSVHESYEDWQHNPYLKKSYDDPAKNFLESQKWFIKRKWEQICDGASTDVFIQDVSPEMDFCYAATNLRLTRMSQENFKAYEKFYRELDWSLAPAPDLLIYLQVSDAELLKRAEDSKREFETVEGDYFLTMKRVNREWLSGVKGNAAREYRVLVVNTDMMDFAHDEQAKRALVEKVRKIATL